MKNGTAEEDKTGEVIYKVVSSYWKPDDIKVWTIIKVVIVILVLLSTYEVWTLRQEIGYEQTKQLVSCPSYYWDGTHWKPNLTLNISSGNPSLHIESRQQ